jgi:hypothetical protein
MVLADTVSVWPSIPGMERKEGEERKLTGEGIPVRAALVLIDGDPPVVGDGDGDEDDVQKATASSKV